MGVRLVRYNNGVITGSGSSGGTYDHNELTNRDLVNQHPISAITGLQESLDEITNTLKDYLLAQTFTDTLKNYSTTAEVNKVLESYAKKTELHKHDNKDILDKLSDVSGTLNYNGTPIQTEIQISQESDNAIQEKSDGLYVADLSSHILKTIFTSEGVHGLRYYNSKLQYQNNSGAWVSISTGGGSSGGGSSGGGIGDIIISTSENNVLTKYPNGYYVPGFVISKQVNNALQKLSDGYYVRTIPANNATTDDIDAAVDEIDNKLTEQNQTFNERYDILTTKIQQIAANTTRFQVHEFSGSNPISIESIIDISTLYSLSSNVILNLELVIKNTSSTDILTIQILENNIETLNDTLTKSEVQRYKLPNIPTIEIFIKGDYQLFLYVNYI